MIFFDIIITHLIDVALNELARSAPELIHKIGKANSCLK